MLTNRLRKKIGIYFVGMFASKIFPIFLIPIYAFYVTSETLGYFDLINTVMGIAVPIMYLAIWEAILRFILYEKNKRIKIGTISTSALFIVSISFFVILCSLFIEIIPKNSNLNIFFISLVFVSHGLAITWQYYARSLEYNKLFVYSGIIGTTVNFISVVFFIIILKLQLNGLLMSYLLGQLAIFIFIELKIKLLFNLRLGYFNTNILKKMLVFSSPLVLNLISTWLMSAFGRFLIISKLGVEVNGLYSFANRFSIIISMMGSVVTMAIIEEAIISAKTTGFDSKFKETIEKVFITFQTLALIAIPMIAIFYKFIQETEYYGSFLFVPWLLIFSVSNTISSNLGSIFQAISKTQYQFITTVIGASATVISSILLISYLGIYAVIIGQIIGSLTMLLSRYLFVNRHVDLKFNWIPKIYMLFLYILVSIVCICLNIIFTIITLLVIAILICYFNRKYLNEIIIKLKKKY